VRKELRGVRKAVDAPTLTPHSSSLTPSSPPSLLFPHSYQGTQGLADDLRYYGRWMRDEAEKRIGHLYPKVKVTKEMAKDRPDLKTYVGQELTVIAWLWARTVKCANPGCGQRMPMLRSFWLSKKKGKETFADPVVDLQNGKVTFRVCFKGQPQQETSNRDMARCLFCGNMMKKGPLREQATAHGMQEIPLAVVAGGTRGRVYLEASCANIPEVAKPEVPELDQLITDDKRWFSPPQYGLPKFRDLFTARQLTALTTFSDLVGEARAKVLANALERSEREEERSELRGVRKESDTPTLTPQSSSLTPLSEGGTGPQAYADAVATYLAFVVDKLADLGNSLNRWEPNAQCPRQLFARQAIPMVWDFAEGNPFSSSSGSWSVLLDNLKGAFASPLFNYERSGGGASQQIDATAEGTYTGSPCVSTDPPYYDNIGYADLSDFFYVWLRRTLKGVYPQCLSTMLTPKATEMIASPYRHDGSKAKAAAFFEGGLGNAIGQWREHGCPDYPTSVFYAFKQAETDAAGTASTGWETFLTGVIEHGFAITGTWPMRTECGSRMVGQGTNALASSVVLACVPREPNAPMATRREFLNTLKRELPDAMKKLQSGNIAPVDLAQAAIGPGMAVFSRYSKVVESDGATMTVRTALTLINQSLDEVLAEQEGEFDADTRWAVAWFEQHGTQEGPYGVAETLSKAKNTSVAGLVEAGLVAARGGKVKLLGRDAMPDGWDPAADKRPTCWEAAQHLIRRLQTQGEPAAAALLARLGAAYGETARDLAYRLYSICERKKWADEALAYNGLVIAWPELTKLALAGRPSETQSEMF